MGAQLWAERIRHARNATEQAAVLRALKNEIIGHPLKKEMVVTMGILDSIVRLSFGKSSSRQNGKSHDHSFAPRPLAEEEMVRLLSLHIISSIALGGPSFLPALYASSALPAILSNLCPTNNPPRLVLAAVKALSNLADSSALATNTHTFSIITLAEALFTRTHLNALSRILSQTSSTISIQSQIVTTASLISKICREERHQQALANFGVLDALATKLASFVVAQGFVVPGADLSAQRDGLGEYFPSPAPQNSNFAVILEAIAVIIKDSKLRASQLLYSPSILAIFPIGQSNEFMANHNARAAWNAFNSAGLSSRQSQLNAIDHLLPFVPRHQLRSSNAQSSSFPPLGTSGSTENLTQNGRSTADKHTSNSLWTWMNPQVAENGVAAQDNPSADWEEPESPLIAYLILVLRSRIGMVRLMAASVLTVLYRMGLTNKTRETVIGLLVVPLLVQMLDHDVAGLSKSKDLFTVSDVVRTDQAMKERAPAILAMLITDNEYLQKAAYDAGAVNKLSKMIKVAYDPVLDTAHRHTWSPHGQNDVEELDGPQSSGLGQQGLPPLLVHKIKVRESTLNAIATLVSFKDEYRKAVVDSGTIPYIVESMNPEPRKPSPKLVEKPDQPEKVGNDLSEAEAKKPPQGYGTNPVIVIIAACGAIRALTRSVSILRTTLIDNGIAMPVFKHLRHPDIEVQIAATGTVCNLVTDVSPMRETISNAGVVKILCEHAHSTNAKLRLNAVWALKHFVDGVSNEMKRLCLEELGQGWLVQLICDDTEDAALISSRGKGDRGLTSGSHDEIDEDIEMDHFEHNIDLSLGGSFSRSNPSRPSSSRSKSIQRAELRLAALRDAETNPVRKARNDDIAVQEQGLDFIRNLIGGSGHGANSETTEMIDFLFNALGQDRVFEILASKVKPKVINPFSRRSHSAETKLIPPQSEIISSVGWILVHMAASVPRHRQLVIAQTNLLKILVPQFNHPSSEVRLSLCWLVTNLTWVDDTSDTRACVQRANELKQLGFLEKLEMLEQDPELNVRERAKSALWQMKQPY
ncbi:hypothetical protein B7494_g6500 [Chlorociboria aeruginascens]|nr:hypothetical protein B7494_g6500 [Chlorociboria aeruginascens]